MSWLGRLLRDFISPQPGEHRQAAGPAPKSNASKREPAASRQLSATGGQAAPQRLETTRPFTLERMEKLIADLGYYVRRQEDGDHASLLGSWDSFPFLIEELEDYPAWLLIAGDWPEPAPAAQRDEIAASVNDWNRDKFFPTVCVLDIDDGVLVRANYLVDLSSGVTDRQLRLHLERALSACTQALASVGPLFPEV
ncbi:YbjN domain-containing protein [Actinomyces trachealis]|uniref:YbjN domain-containing protein n=1 Tax=Actinomyces trachealis TaxID=2763540 RepID=UPI0018C462AF|nr:YbjN domain-containing protein [Actinomyces trachealis]